MTTLSATDEDVARWQREKRWDILQWCMIFDIDGKGHGPADLWISPTTGMERPRCPFVRKDRDRPTYKCTIYDTRPQVCRDFEPFSARPGEWEICEDVESPATIRRQSVADENIGE